MLFAGSIPCLLHQTYALVAQTVERLVETQEVGDSKPPRCANSNSGLAQRQSYRLLSGTMQVRILRPEPNTGVFLRKQTPCKRQQAGLIPAASTIFNDDGLSGPTKWDPKDQSELMPGNRRFRWRNDERLSGPTKSA